MNQAQLSNITGVRPNTISDIYNEFVEKINLDTLDRICDALDCSLHEILVHTPKVKQPRLKRYTKKPRNPGSCSKEQGK